MTGGTHVGIVDERDGRVAAQALALAGSALAPVLESIEPALDGLANAVVPQVADWFALHLFADGVPRLVVERGLHLNHDQLAVDGYEQSLAGALSPGEPVVFRGFARTESSAAHQRWWRSRGLDTVAVVPVRTRGLTLGGLSIGTVPGRPLTDADVQLAVAIAERVAVSLERVAQHRETKETARDAARQATRLRHLMEAAVVLGGATSEHEVVHRLAAAARRVSGSTGAAVTIERGPGAPIKTVDGQLPEHTVEFSLFDGNRQRAGQLIVGRPDIDAEGYELGLIALAQIGGALIENRRLLDSLERSRGHLQALVDASPDAIIELDADGLVLTANRVAGAVLGHPLPVHLGNMLDGDGAITLAEHLAKAVADDTPPRFEVHADRGGESVVLSIALAPLVNGGRTERIVALISDVTEQRRMEEQFLRAQRMDAIGRLAGGIAHDFNNLITAIIGFGELAAASLPDDHAARDDLKEVVAAGRRAADLTAQLLSLGRGQAMERTVIDVEELFAGMRRMLERVLPADVSLEVSAPRDARVRGDRGQLEQVLLNLAINARDAMPSGGRLSLAASNDHEASLVRISVSDTGTGMDGATAERCFEPFFTTKDHGRGTGLGLSAAYGIITNHEGTLSVASRPGEGTTFAIELSSTAEPDRPGAVASKFPGSGSETILFVEDQSAVRSLVAQVLRSRGYEVLVAARADEALSLAEAEGTRIDLLLTDIVMPGISGADLADRLRDRLPGLRVLYMSGYARGALEQRGSIDGDVAFLAKPFDPDRLARRVREVLDTPSR